MFFWKFMIISFVRSSPDRPKKRSRSIFSIIISSGANLMINIVKWKWKLDFRFLLTVWFVSTSPVQYAPPNPPFFYLLPSYFQNPIKFYLKFHLALCRNFCKQRGGSGPGPLKGLKPITRFGTPAGAEKTMTDRQTDRAAVLKLGGNPTKEQISRLGRSPSIIYSMKF